MPEHKGGNLAKEPVTVGRPSLVKATDDIRGDRFVNTMEKRQRTLACCLKRIVITLYKTKYWVYETAN